MNKKLTSIGKTVLIVLAVVLSNVASIFYGVTIEYPPFLTM